MANQALVFGLIGSGGILLTSALTGSSIGEVLAGHPGSVSSVSSLGANGGAVASVGNAVANAANAGKSTVTGSVTPSMLATIGKTFGWSGQELSDWMAVISRESGGNPNATNSSSGAYGIGQFLASGGSPTNLAPNKEKYYTYGGDPNTVTGQLTGMANYIKARYGTPSAALAHENSAGWY